jgi:hypothetical protein
VNKSRVFIWFVAASFLLYGAFFAFWPEVFFQKIFGVVPTTADALVEVRATCGGMAFALGAALIVIAQKPHLLPVGLKLVIVIMMIIAIARAFGMALSSSFSSLVVGYLIFELVVAGIAVYLLGREQPSRQQAPSPAQFSK